MGNRLRRDRISIVSHHSSDQPTPVVTADVVTELSHDLRTPLAVIRIQAQMLKRLAGRNPEGDPAVRERYLVGLERIDQAVTALNEVLERTLDRQTRSATRPVSPVCDEWHSPPGT